jgi:hypothetical protein
VLECAEMANLQAEIQKLVDGFVTQITELARRAAIDTLESALSPGRSTPLTSRNSKGRGSKRTGAELDRLSDEFIVFVTKNPGLRIEQINKHLNTTTKDLALPIRKLLADGTLKVKGRKRSTAYFPGKAKN